MDNSQNPAPRLRQFPFQSGQKVPLGQAIQQLLPQSGSNEAQMEARLRAGMLDPNQSK